MSSELFKNAFLQHLDQETVRRLHLRFLELPLLHELAAPGKTIDAVFFLEEGIASMTTLIENG